MLSCFGNRVNGAVCVLQLVEELGTQVIWCHDWGDLEGHSGRQSSPHLCSVNLLPLAFLWAD